jgi:hypothetical protein
VGRKTKFLVLLEKEFKEGHRGDLRRRMFVNAKQRERKATVYSPDGRVGRLKNLCCSRDPKISGF